MPAKSIIIVGDGVAGWLAASLLSRALPDGTWQITLLDDAPISDSLGLPLQADYLSPRALEMLCALGYDEPIIIRAARGTISLGNAFSDWGADGTLFQGFGAAGAPIGPLAFHQLAARLRAEGEPINLANYTLSALCAQTSRFAPPELDRNSVLSALHYGLHVDTSALSQFTRGDALARGVRHLSGAVQKIMRSDTGLIDAVITGQGIAYSGDLYIDCTGTAARLMRDKEKGWEDWSQWLACDRFLTSVKPSQAPPLCYAHIVPHDAGWQRFVPLQGTVEETFVYQAARLDQVLPDATTFAPGHHITPWHGNVLAIGGAAVVIASPGNPQLELALAAISRLIGLLPTTRDCAAEAQEYNRQTIAEYKGARDVAIATGRLNARHGELFWDACRNMRLPQRLAHKISLYEQCGRLALYDDEIYDEADWIALFEALGLRARRYDAQADGLTSAAIAEHFKKIRTIMLEAVNTLPTHATYLASLAG